MPSLLVPNDDGVHAPGLAALEAALAELGDVYVLAPEREQSACGHALTLHRPLRVDRLGERRFAGNGDRKSTRLNSSHDQISYAVFCLKKKKIGIKIFGRGVRWHDSSISNYKSIPL